MYRAGWRAVLNLVREMVFPFYRGGNSNFLKLLPGRVEIRPKGSTCQCRRLRFYPWVRKDLWKRDWQPTSVFLPGKSHGQRSLVSYSLWDCKRTEHDWVTKPPPFKLSALFTNSKPQRYTDKLYASYMSFHNLRVFIKRSLYINNRTGMPVYLSIQNEEMYVETNKSKILKPW